MDNFVPEWADFGSMFWARDDADSVFLIELDHEVGTRSQWTVAEWKVAVAAASRWLVERGVADGDVVAALAKNRAEALIVAYSCWNIGACYVPLSSSDSEDRQRAILTDSSPRLFICCDVARPLASWAASVGLPTVSSGQIPKNGLTGAADQETVRYRPVGGLNTAALRVYTSGTTGPSKGVQLTIANLLTDCDGLISRLQWAPNTRILTVLPIHHVNGLLISSLLPWIAGFSTVLCDRFRTSSFWSDARAEGATVCSVVPSILEFLLQEDGDPDTPLREILCGAGPLLVETATRFEAATKLPIRHLYGLSETTAVATLMPCLSADARRHWHQYYNWPSIGIPLPHVDVAVVDDGGVEVAEGQRGEIVVRGAVVMQGYANMPRETSAAVRSGWFHTGDQGFWVRHGDDEFFFITGRLKELIIRGGVNISPLEIDAVLNAHPAVDFALALPFANSYYGDEIAAYVVPNRAIDDDELFKFWAEHLPFARQPKVIIRGTDVPFTATGKAKRIELAQNLAPELTRYKERQFRPRNHAP